jgi:hypothetical protein
MALIRGILNTMPLLLPCRQKNDPDHKNNPDQIKKKMQYTLHVLHFLFENLSKVSDSFSL